MVANNDNDSISVIDTASNAVLFEHDLRPFAAGNAEGMTFNADRSRLHVAQDNADQVAVIDTGSNTRRSASTAAFRRSRR